MFYNLCVHKQNQINVLKMWLNEMRISTTIQLLAKLVYNFTMQNFSYIEILGKV